MCAISTKLVVLGINGLDYRYVDLYAPILKQKDWHVYEVPDIYCHSTMKIPISVLIWSSIITGKNPRELGISVKDVWKQKEVRIKKDILTLFDIVPESVGLFIPGYNPHPKYWMEDLKALVEKCFKDDVEGRNARLKYYTITYGIFNEQRDVLFREVLRNRKLIFIHFNIIDALSHVFTQDHEYVKIAYREVSGLVPRLYSHGYDVLIVSDHGFEGHSHSRYAFVSFNKKLPFKPKDPKGIFNLILTILGYKNI